MYNCTVSSNFLLDKGGVAKNLQKECLCYLIYMYIETFIVFFIQVFHSQYQLPHYS